MSGWLVPVSAVVLHACCWGDNGHLLILATVTLTNGCLIDSMTGCIASQYRFLAVHLVCCALCIVRTPKLGCMHSLAYCGGFQGTSQHNSASSNHCCLAYLSNSTHTSLVYLPAAYICLHKWRHKAAYSTPFLA